MRLVSPELQSSGRGIRYATLFGPWALLSILAGGITALFAVVTTEGNGVAAGWNDSLFYCDSSGRIRYQYTNTLDTVSPYWDNRLFLSVTMGFHGLTFVQAKAIDICFDLVVGRGSQVLLTLATYPILRRSIMRSMEVREFSLALLLPVFMERLSIWSLWAMFANMRVRRRQPKTDDQAEEIKFKKAKIRIDWRVILVFLVGCYVLALPTFTSVMTSYQIRSAPFMPSENDTAYVSANDFQSRISDFVLQNGELVGLSPGFPMYKDSDTQLLPTCLEYAANAVIVEEMRTNITLTYASAWSEPGLNEDERVAAFNRTLQSMPGRQNVTDKRDPPLWSFTLYPRQMIYLTDNRDSWWRNWSAIDSMIVIDNTTHDLGSDRLVVKRNILPDQGGWPQTTWLAYDNNISYTASDILERGKCLPADDYIWGFSSLMLFTFCMITIAVALILITLHYDAYFNSAADRYRLSISPYRDVLDLAEELRAHYGVAETADMPAKELDRAMRKDPVATGLETDTLHRSRRARWKQAKASRKSFTQSDARKRSRVVDGRAAADAEESLMSIGTDAQLQFDMEMAKLPARVASRSTNGTQRS